MPLNGDFAAIRTLIAGLRPEQLRRPIVLGAQGALPRLMQEAITARRTPAGKEWAPNVRPGEARPLTRLAQGFTVEASPQRLTVRNPHPGAGPLQYGRPGQDPRNFLPMRGLPREWGLRLSADGRETLRRTLRAD